MIPVIGEDGMMTAAAGPYAGLDSAVARDPARFEATYDRTYGYPTSVSIDYITNVADDEIYYSVLQFSRQ